MTLSAVIGASSTCRSCEHTAPTSAFPVHVFFTEKPIDVEGMIQAMANDMRAEVGQHMARAFASFLQRWGFLPWEAGAQVTPGSTEYYRRVAILNKYAINGAQALLASVLFTREELEKKSRAKKEADLDRS